MLRRTLIPLFALAVLLAGGRAEAVTIRDVIELTKAGLSESVLLALIDVDRSVFAIDTATLKELKGAGVSDSVIVAMIRSGREPRAEAAESPVPPAAAVQEAVPIPREPEEEPIAPVPMPIGPPPQPVVVPYPVPVYVPVPVVQPRGNSRRDTVKTTIETDQGALVNARVPLPPNCVKAQPVYWGFGGKLRPGSWQPEPAVVCR